MPSDLHLHLRPDEPGSTAERYFTAANAERYREVAVERGITELGVSEHIYRFEQALSVWEHPLWRENARDDLERYAAFVREETDLLLGIEADFVPGREDRLATLLESVDFDYVVGSVHFLRDAAVDHEGWDVWDGSHSAEEIWRRYFESLAEAARSGLYDILAHPDLVKVWGARRPLPEGDLRRFYEPAVQAIADSGVAVEVSTAGWRKPVGEIYPAPALLEMLIDAGAPLALSSDAHRPEDVGHRYPDALVMLEAQGVRELVTFRHRERRTIPLGGG